MAPDWEPIHEEIVDAMGELTGVHQGYRAAHAKGTLCAGTFTASDAAPGLSRAAHLGGDPVRVTARFSNGSGDPTQPDGKQDGRGFAVKFYLDDGATTDIVALTLPCFFVRNREDFLEFLRARVPDPDTGEPDMGKLGKFFEVHPEALPAIQAALAEEPPESYARLVYNSIHSFRLVNADGEGRWVRYRWIPEAGAAAITTDEAKARGHDYLQEEIIERMQAGLVRFTLTARLAAEDDPIDDPTVAWPEERESAELGTLELTGPDTEREQGDDVLVFDPVRMTDGVETSDDAVLHARSPAYSVSVARRTSA